jgi:DNA-binding winged helix-turn-helix (wHTH) protein/TolB-like protein
VFEFDGRTLELTKNGRSVAIRPQPLKLLALLLINPGELVSRSELQRSLWDGDTFIDFEQGVNHAVRELRAALGDDAESPRFIQTLPRRGYRFIAPVVPLAVVQPLHSTAAPDRPAASTEPVTPHRAESRSGSRRMLVAVASLVLVAAVIGLAYIGLRFGIKREASLLKATTLAVRPISVPSDPTLGVGLANAISARLAQQQAATVWSERTRTRTPAGEDDTGWPVGATHVLEGEAAMTGTRLDVVVRLRDRADATLWSERIQVDSAQLFDIEAVIAERVVGALRLQLAATEQARLRQRYTKNGAAHADYLRGRAALTAYTREGTLSAVQAFEHALQRDPAYTLARAGLAMASADMYLRFAAAEEAERWGERAEAEARAALALDPDLAEAHLARAAVARKREFDWDATLTESRRALTLNPNLDQARFFAAGAYYHSGYMEEALIEMEKGRSLHGVDIIEPIRIEALVALFSGNFAPALARLEEVSRLSSQPVGDTYLALAYYYAGSVARARTMLEGLSIHRSASTAARASAALAGVLAAQGEHRASRLLLDRVMTANYRDHHVAYSIGAAYAQLGDADASRQWLRTAADTGFPCVPFFERDPLLEPLRRLPGFTDLVGYVRSRREFSFRP